MGGPGSGNHEGKRSDDLDDEIVRRLSLGHTLREICRDNSITTTSVYNWEKSDKDFGLRVARARDDGEKAIEDEILEIADDGRNDWVERQREDGSSYQAYDSDHVQRSKLRIETRLKVLAFKNPARYGTNRVDLTSHGRELKGMTETERGARIAGLLDAAAQRKDKAESDDADG